MAKAHKANRYVLATLAVCVCLYLLAVVSLWVLVRFAGDRWWLATLVLFGPRWICALPLALLAPASVWLRRRLLWPLAASAAVVVWPLMQFCIPWGRIVTTDGPTLRVLTCNVKGHCRDNATLNRLIRETAPDIVTLQGCWGEVRIAWPPGWSVCQQGEILVASRYSVHEGGHLTGLQPPHQGPRVDLLDCVVRTSVGNLYFVAVHLPSPRHGISAVPDRLTLIGPSRRARMEAEIALRQQASREARQTVALTAMDVIVAGDFNLPTDSWVYCRDWAGFGNAFSASGFGFGHTEWPSVRGRWFGIRIDHILTGPGWHARRCWVGPDVGSDHLPLIADICLGAARLSGSPRPRSVPSV